MRRLFPAVLSVCGRGAEAKNRGGPVPYAYIFFSEQVLVAASHIPPAFLQSASVFAAVTSAAKAGLFRSAQIWRSNHRVQRYCGGVRPRRLHYYKVAEKTV